MFFIEDVAQWSREQFAGAGLCDERRDERLVTLACGFAARPGKSIPHLFDRRYDVQAAYKFLYRPEVTPDSVQAVHQAFVEEELHRPGVHLLIEDTSDFSWSGKARIQGLGPIGEGKAYQQGFKLHTVLAARWHSPDACAEHRPPLEVLGLADQQFYVRSKKAADASEGDRAKTTRELESHLWQKATERVGTAPDDPNIRWIRVCDSAADIYDFMADCQLHGHGFVIRAARNHALLDETGQDIGHLFEQVRQARRVGRFELHLRARRGQDARLARLSVSYTDVVIRSPFTCGVGIGRRPALVCSAIRIWEEQAPLGVEALEWVLLTDVQVSSFAQARECGLQYASRWLVEEFHQVLKSGMGAERLQLETADALFAAIAVMSVVALRLLDFKERLRLYPDAPAQESGLDPLELEILAMRLGRQFKTVRDVGRAVARLGGHMSGPPGWKTLWEGWLELQAMAAGARLILQMRRFEE
jgi:hypothetical protein